MDFIWFYGLAEKFENAKKVRLDVFVTEQGYSPECDTDKNDEISWHIVGYDEGTPVCTSRLFTEGESKTYHIGRVAVSKDYRGKKLGLKMVEMLVEKAAQLGAKKLVLNAQEDKASFYLRAGFSLTGKKLLDEGQPHVELDFYIN